MKPFTLFFMGGLWVFCLLGFPAWADSWDPADNLPAGATNLDTPPPTEQLHGPHTLGDPDTADWFRFTLEEGFQYEFYTSGSTDTVLNILRDDGTTIILTDDDSGTDLNAFLQFTPNESGTFLIKVFQYDASVVNTYTLHYLNRSQAEDPKDEWDPDDDTYHQATPLGRPQLSEFAHGPHFLNPSDRYDWFAFTLTEGEIYEFSSTSGSDLVADLFYQNERIRVAHNDDGGFEQDFSLIHVPENGGTYYLRVSLFNQHSYGTYTLFYSIGTDAPPAGDDWDPKDDIFEGAAMLGTPSSASQSHGPHSLSDTDENDWFVFVLNEGEEYVFASDSSINLTGELYASNGTRRIAIDEDSGEEQNFQLVYTPKEDGKYYIKVFAPERTAGEYNLTYQQTADAPSPVLDEWDPTDDERPGANPLAMPTNTQQTHGPHSLSPSDLGDWYKVSLSANENYIFHAEGSSDTFAAIHTEGSNTPLLEKDNGGPGYNFRFSFTPSTTGDYYLHVRMFDIGAMGEYTLHYQIASPIPTGLDTWDPADDEFSTSTELDVPTNKMQSHGPHTLSPADTEDWFQLFLQKGMVYEFTSSGDADTVASLFSADGATKKAEDDSSGEENNFRLTYTPESSSIYYLRITEFNHEKAAYTLHYRAEAFTNIADWSMY
ncbi:hypothetical protein GF373_08170 [bacterium]|nr:hypothetical protein [bacterium]